MPDHSGLHALDLGHQAEARPGVTAGFRRLPEHRRRFSITSVHEVNGVIHRIGSRAIRPDAPRPYAASMSDLRGRLGRRTRERAGMSAAPLFA